MALVKILVEPIPITYLYINGHNIELVSHFPYVTKRLKQQILPDVTEETEFVRLLVFRGMLVVFSASSFFFFIRFGGEIGPDISEATELSDCFLLLVLVTRNIESKIQFP